MGSIAAYEQVATGEKIGVKKERNPDLKLHFRRHQQHHYHRQSSLLQAPLPNPSLQVPYGGCFLCLNGISNLCEDVQFAGVYPFAGTLQRFKVHPAQWLHK